MERDKFEALVEQALRSLPRTFREKLTNIAIIVEDRPTEEPERGLLLGLFHGIPRTEKSVFFSSPPDRIFLYQRNIEAICRSDAEIRRQIRATLLHEVGHYFGLSEDELRKLLKTVNASSLMSAQWCSRDGLRQGNGRRDDGARRAHSLILRGSRGNSSSRTRASTISGSNWRPASRMSSSRAAVKESASR